MIQARASEDGAPLGIFIEQADGKQRTMLCGAADVSFVAFKRASNV